MYDHECIETGSLGICYSCFFVCQALHGARWKKREGTKDAPEPFLKHLQPPVQRILSSIRNVLSRMKDAEFLIQILVRNGDDDI